MCTEECDLITASQAVKGRLEVTTSHVYFWDLDHPSDPGRPALFTSDILTVYSKIYGFSFSVERGFQVLDCAAARNPLPALQPATQCAGVLPG